MGRRDGRSGRGLDWSSTKEEAHQRAVSTGAWLGRRGTAVRGGGRLWRSVAQKSGRDMGARWGGVDGARWWPYLYP
jgi:hypothetical protein